MKEKSRYSTELSDEDEVPGIAQENESPELFVQTSIEYDNLSPKQRDAIRERPMLRRQASFVLMMEGKSYTEISHIFGTTISQTIYDCNKIARELAEAGVIEVEAERIMALTRLQKLTDVYFKKAVDGDLDAATFMLSLETRRAKITGIDQPLKMKIDHRHTRITKARMSQDEFDKRMMNLVIRMRKRGKLSGALLQWYEVNKNRTTLEAEVLASQIESVAESAPESPNSDLNRRKLLPGVYKSADSDEV